MIAVWYFYEKSRFLASREQLKKFLVSSGTITDIDLNFSGSLAIDQPGYTDMDSGNNDLLPVRLNTTGYESLGTAGLFFTVEISGYGVQPGEIQYSGNNEHYIVYYGTAEPASLASRIDILREIIGQTYTYDRVISAEPL
ncbi:hypothetical protein [Methanoregula formicica]|nr:hypothetical protein [Methanoregula formicica]